MKQLSTQKLAYYISQKRVDLGLSQEQLSEKTGINRAMISRIETENYIPSISQLEVLTHVLKFDLMELFSEQQENQSFIAMRSEDLSENEKAGVEKLFTMMVTLKQQIILRNKYENKESH